MQKKSKSKTSKKSQNDTIAINSSEESSFEQNSFSIVGIGASAGGLGAFESFFSSMSSYTKPNMAFVLVQHLAPDHKSILTEIIQRYTNMHVFEVEDGMKVEVNCTYIIPPNKDMALINGKLQLLEPITPRAQRLPIDYFFRSLAQDQADKSIGIVLSGTGSDGTQGIRAIKAAAGMVIAQKLSSCEYEGMPESAINTGLVDYELSPSDMPQKLMEYTKYVNNITSKDIYIQQLNGENELRKVFILLRDQTSHDFSQYKPSTINRRIERRMALNQIENLSLYVKYLQQTPREVDDLFHELLIGVTSFFRDKDAFVELKRALPKIFKNKKPGDTIRVWSVGCSSGEEAYSLAILLYEYMHEENLNFAVQLFATDIDPNAIDTARAGIYPKDIALDISKERLSHFFKYDSDIEKYRIHKTIRDMLIFSEQNIIKDPPFSKLDLIVCRNLLIYMNSDIQRKIIPTFHYALNDEGVLFLGSSETIGEFGNLFVAIDHKSKLFQRKNNTQGTYPMATHSTGVTQPLPRQVTQKISIPIKVPLRELTEQTLLQEIAPSAILVDERGDILYLYGNAGTYLELPSGETGINNILKMTHNSLQRSLIIALHKATETKETVRSIDVKVKTNDHFRMLNISVVPVSKDNISVSKATLYLVIFQESDIADDDKNASMSELQETSSTNSYIKRLTQELHDQEEFLKTSNEKLNISNEELRSSNEEIQSMNEELQSSNEELETSKEELQSVNEELSTVNAELQMKVVALSRSNNDMNNLLAGTGIGTIFVDHDLNLLRFTPAATKIINLISSDIGRPINHIVSNILGYNNLQEDLQEVLENLIPKEIEVKTVDGKYYIMCIQPYRTLENVIEGAVVTFTEISETVQMREDLSELNTRLLAMTSIIRDSNDAIIMQDLDGNILSWNPQAQKMYGWSETEALKMNVEQMVLSEDKKDEIQKIYSLSKSETIKPYRTKRVAKDGAIVDVLITSTALINEDKDIYAIVTTQRKTDSRVTELKELKKC
ncbi:MAG: PAS domain-containing protein [Sulfurimonas sp.]|uniref:chemotaxis protein CheB n=1 Tax=Sulfurimonas sp. TaxID=2022749 RepID=UPI002627D586|nr:chemotaxis protein CheB [Sulfurimonas sp.]MCW8895755.1 PAS domain-containing protein [Sulfurimonas sp.]MCW8953436.1 PAS domain-containing protein [Sulfurimonas sp.]MCW9067048.1 PAS domain-containing protein [Sulfurimonas sp.]